MTDEELGAEIYKGAPSLMKVSLNEWLAFIGNRARTILAAERPEVTREAVKDFIKSQVRPSGDLDCHWKWAFEGAWRALSHFAPPREARPIDGMSVDDISQAAANEWEGGKIGGDFRAWMHVCRVAHRLAQPVPKTADTEKRPQSVTFSAAEMQSGLDRIRYAEGLIRQLPKNHDGRNTWLLNYGAGGVSCHYTQPVPVVDPDAAAKRLHALAKEAAVKAGWPGEVNEWDALHESVRVGWRAAAAAKEAGREDHT